MSCYIQIAESESPKLHGLYMYY